MKRRPEKIISFKPLKFETYACNNRNITFSKYIINLLKTEYKYDLENKIYVWLKVNDTDYLTKVQKSKYSSSLHVHLQKGLINGVNIVIEPKQFKDLNKTLKRSNQVFINKANKKFIDMYAIIPHFTREYKFTRNGVVKKICPQPLSIFSENNKLLIYQDNGCFFQCKRLIELSPELFEWLGSYFAEGKKATSNVDFALTNSNPSILIDFLKFANYLFLIDNSRWQILVQTGNKKSKVDETKITNYWSKELGMPESQIRIYWSHPCVKKKYGVATARIGNKVAKEVVESILSYFLKNWKTFGKNNVRSFLNGIECRDTSVCLNSGRTKITFANKYKENVVLISKMYEYLNIHAGKVVKSGKEIYSFEIARQSDMFKLLYHEHFKKNPADFEKIKLVMDTYQGKIICFLSKKKRIKKQKLFLLFYNRSFMSQMNFLKNFGLLVEKDGFIKLKPEFKKIVKTVCDDIEIKKD